MLDLKLILLLCCFFHLGSQYYVDWRSNIPFPALCPPGFEYQYGFKACININNKGLTFKKAQAVCRAKGGKLWEVSRTTELEKYIYYRTLKNHVYWLGITYSTDLGVWTFASDNSPYTSDPEVLSFLNQSVGNHCVMYNRTMPPDTYIYYPAVRHPAVCQNRARSICVYDPPTVCGIRNGGEFMPFNATYVMQLVSVPCDYIMASIVCGDYDVRVYGTNLPVISVGRFSPANARVVVERAMTHQLLIDARVSRHDILKSTDGKHLWKVTDGAWSEEVGEAFDPARNAAVLKIGDVGQVVLSVSSFNSVETIEYGLYVRCKDVKSSVEFPGSLCDFMERTSDESTKLADSNFDILRKGELITRAIFQQNASDQCSDIATKVRSCPNEAEAVRTCAPIFVYPMLTRCLEADRQWFARCLDAYCDNNVDTCTELKSKVATCNLVDLNMDPEILKPFKELLDTC